MANSKGKKGRRVWLLVGACLIAEPPGDPPTLQPRRPSIDHDAVSPTLTVAITDIPPGFKLVADGKSLTTGPTGVTHHIRMLKFGGHIEMEINGKVIFKWDDPEKPLGAGRIGFRSMEGVSMITYDNFKVWKVTKR